MSFEQIEKFHLQLLKGFHMVSLEPTWHVSCVQKRFSKFDNFKVQKVQNPELFDLTDKGFWSGDARGLICRIPRAIFQKNNVGLGTFPSRTSTTQILLMWLLMTHVISVKALVPSPVPPDPIQIPKQSQIKIQVQLDWGDTIQWWEAKLSA